MVLCFYFAFHTEQTLSTAQIHHFTFPYLSLFFSLQSSNPFYLNCQLYGKSDYCLVLLNSCLAKVGRSEEVALLEPHLEMPFNKRSFRNGVGSGIKKTSFRRAKS